MIDKIFELGPQLDVKIYTLISGKTIIGEYCSTENDSVRINCPLLIKHIASTDYASSEILVPMFSDNDNEPCILFNGAIESITNASIEMKTKYIESLIINRANQLLTLYESNINDSLFDPSLELVKQLSQ